MSPRRRLNSLDPDAVARELGLRRSGTRYWCPFCQNDGLPHATPDLSHAPGRGAWRCFRCGWHGTNAKLYRDVMGRDMEHGDVDAMAAKAAARLHRSPPTPGHATVEDAIRATLVTMGDGWTVTRQWKYTDSYITVRFDHPTQGKQFRQYRYSKSRNGWVSGAPRPPRPLYIAVPRINIARGGIVVVEGEKCADAVASLGIVGVTSPGGAHGAKNADWPALRRLEPRPRVALIIPDNDDPGREYASAVYKLLVWDGIIAADKCKIMDLPDVPVGGDIADAITMRGARAVRSAVMGWLTQVLKLDHE